MIRSRRITVRLLAKLPTPEVADVRAALAAGYTLDEVRQWAGTPSHGRVDVGRLLGLRRILGR